MSSEEKQELEEATVEAEEEVIDEEAGAPVEKTEAGIEDDDDSAKEKLATDVAGDEAPAEEKPDSIYPEPENLSYADEMRQSYLEYSLAVIQDRALPDVRDGLNPVQRRILHVLRTLSLMSTAKPKKSVNVVGNTLAYYHPHGDSSVYNAMVLMSQDFRFRVPLIDGQGNFGSLEDPPAAMRYTEARLSPAGDHRFRLLLNFSSIQRISAPAWPQR